MMSDWECLELARKGDETAWHRLIERHNPQLIKMTLLITGSMDAARDLAQETFVRLFHHGVKHSAGSFKAYLSTIAYRLALKEKKRAARNRDLNHVNPADDAPTPLEAVLQKERDYHLVRVINSLEEHHRNILILRFYGENTYEEIARITNLPLGTVKSRIFYGVKTCQKKLREKGILR